MRKLILISLLLCFGCAHEKTVKISLDTPVATAFPTPHPTETVISPEIVSKDEAPLKIEKSLKIYVVKKGDCLWNIAKKKSIYGNPWEWPLIYKYNSTQIQDPNLIEKKQRLNIFIRPNKKQRLQSIREAEAFTP